LHSACQQMQTKEISKQDLEDYHSSIIQTNTHLYLASHPNKQLPISKYSIMHTTTSENVDINYPNRAPQSSIAHSIDQSVDRSVDRSIGIDRYQWVTVGIDRWVDQSIRRSAPWHLKHYVNTHSISTWYNTKPTTQRTPQNRAWPLE
jgi:hypothetical protein